MSLARDLLVFGSKAAIVALVAVIVLCAVGGFLAETWAGRDAASDRTPGR